MDTDPSSKSIPEEFEKDLADELNQIDKMLGLAVRLHPFEPHARDILDLVLHEAHRLGKQAADAEHVAYIKKLHKKISELLKSFPEEDYI